MFARFDENPAMTLRVIKETKRYGRTDGQRENSIPPTNKVCGGYNKTYFPLLTLIWRMGMRSCLTVRLYYNKLSNAFKSRVGVIKIVIVINCNLITFSKVIACNCN